MKIVLVVVVVVENFLTGENYNNYESVSWLRAPPYSYVYVQALVRPTKGTSTRDSDSH